MVQGPARRALVRRFPYGVFAAVELRRRNDEEQFKLEALRAEKGEELALFKVRQEMERARIRSEAELAQERARRRVAVICGPPRRGGGP